jgi:hypothetical protein
VSLITADLHARLIAATLDAALADLSAGENHRALILIANARRAAVKLAEVVLAPGTASADGNVRAFPTRRRA